MAFLIFGLVVASLYWNACLLWRRFGREEINPVAEQFFHISEQARDHFWSRPAASCLSATVQAVQEADLSETEAIAMLVWFCNQFPFRPVEMYDPTSNAEVFVRSQILASVNWLLLLNGRIRREDRRRDKAFKRYHFSA